MFCRSCGTEVGQNAQFCPKCGTPVSGGPSANTQQAQTPAAVQQQYAPQPQPYYPQQSAAVAAAGRGSSSRTILIAALCVVAVALAVLAGYLLFNRLGGAGASDSLAHSASDPVTLEYNGTTIKALHRPTFYDDLPEAASLMVGAPQIDPYEVNSDLSNVTNLKDVYLADEEKALIAKYGFCVSNTSANDEFHELYENNRYAMYANFVTVDSMMHAYHLYFAHLMKTTERTSLSDQMGQLSKEMLQQSADQLDALKGTEWEDAALRNVKYFAVGASLFDSSVSIPSSVESDVKAELKNIQAASGIAISTITGSEEDYSQYKPRGYYEGDAQLEAYFRGMMWYGRMNFKQSDEDLDRSALLMVLALHDGPLDKWEAVYNVTRFFAGESDDCGYYEYYPIAESVYGAGVSAKDLPGNTQAWQSYHGLTAQMEPPAINSVVTIDDGEEHDRMAEEKGYRLMGQRFSLDASIFQKLIYQEVGSNSSGANRMLPNALDIPAALGSDEALSILQDKGETDYSGYMENLQTFRETISDDDNELWNASLYSQWLHTLTPLLTVKGEGYPAFMQSSQWTRKSLQTFLGSYTELKHDTVLYSKQAMAEMGGGPPKRDDRGYVEPEPEVFSRLARLTEATATGLQGYGMISDEDVQNLQLLQELAERLAEISAKELQNESLSTADYELIRTYGGQLEHFWQEVYKGETTASYFAPKEFPAALVTDVATDPNGSVLELGTGKVNKIWVVFPIDGELHIASGSVYSFYQFEQPLSDRLTDTEWRSVMKSYDLEDWVNDFTFIRETNY